MRLLYLSTNKKTLSHLDLNIINAFKQLENEVDHFQFGSIFYNQFYYKKNNSNLIRDIKKFKPDIIIVFCKYHLPFPSNIVQKLKEMKIPIGLWVVNDPYNISIHEKLMNPYHFIITQDSGSMDFYRNKGKECFHLPLAASPDKYFPKRVPGKYKFDICFIGNCWPGRDLFFDNIASFLLTKKFIIIGKKWGNLKKYNLMKHHINNTIIPPNQVANYYNGSKIVLNIQRRQNDVHKNPLNLPANTPNNRTFDIAACKSFQLLDCRDGLDLLYNTGEEIVCFKDINDFRQKVDYYLQNNKERERIALNAYRRTINDHTYLARLRNLISMLSNTNFIVN
ncbi:MAG: CgeB family protein [Bacillota bacterium]